MPRLEELCRSYAGGTPDRNHPEYFGGDIPWIKSGEVVGIVTKTEETLSADGLKNSSAKWVEPGALLIAMYGAGLTAGQVARLGIRATTNQAVLAIVPKHTEDAEYLGYALTAVVPSLLRRKQGSGQPNLNAEIVRRARVPWPSEKTRRAVERVIRGIDSIDRTLTILIDTKRTFKRCLMQQLLTGEKRFPEFRDQLWVEVHLGDVFQERAEIKRNNLPLLSVTNDLGVIPRNELDKRDTSNPDKSKYKRVAIGDIAYNTMRMWQGVSALSSLEGIVSPAYTVAVPTEKIHGPFAKHLFKFAPVVHLFHRYSQGLVDDTLNLKFERFAKIHVRVPQDVEEQKEIAVTLDLCDSELALLATLRKQFDLYKRGVLTRLLSGEIPETT